LLSLSCSQDPATHFETKNSQISLDFFMKFVGCFDLVKAVCCKLARLFMKIELSVPFVLKFGFDQIKINKRFCEKNGENLELLVLEWVDGS
jgi:hypothetical protein